jgi:thioredoxin-dependent peroxiredoxin
MLKVGEMAPDFSLPDQDGTPVTLAALLAGGDLVLYFYPADFTPVCTREACEFRDHHDALRRIGAQVIGVSPQSVASHQRFRTAYSLPFPLLCDGDKTVIRAYGVDGPLGFGVRRATFHIGRDGRVQNRVVADIFLGDHIELIEKVVAKQ